MEPRRKDISREFEQNNFKCKTDTYGWSIEYVTYYNGEKDRKYQFHIGYDKLPIDSSKDFVLGYCKCEALHRGFE